MTEDGMLEMARRRALARGWLEAVEGYFPNPDAMSTAQLLSGVWFLKKDLRRAAGMAEEDPDLPPMLEPSSFPGSEQIARALNMLTKAFQEHVKEHHA